MKLKYDVKEYERLYENWVEFRKRLVLSGVKDGRAVERVGAVQVEKVAFVLGWWAGLGKEERRIFVEMGKEEVQSGVAEEGGEGGPREMDGDDHKGTDDGDDVDEGEQLVQDVGKEKIEKSSRSKRAGKGRKVVREETQSVEGETGMRRSKRLKK